MMEVIRMENYVNVYLNNKLINNCRKYYSWIPEWYKHELWAIKQSYIDRGDSKSFNKVDLGLQSIINHKSSSVVKSLMPDMPNTKLWKDIDYIHFIFVALMRSVTTKSDAIHEESRELLGFPIQLHDAKGYLNVAKLTPKQEKTNWMVRVINDIYYPKIKIPYNGRRKMEANGYYTQYSNMGAIKFGGGWGSINSNWHLYQFLRNLKEQNWNFKVDSKIKFSVSDRGRGLDVNINKTTQTTVSYTMGNILSLPPIRAYPRGEGDGLDYHPKMVYSLNRIHNIFNNGNTTKRNQSQIFNPNMNSKISSLKEYPKIDIPLMFISKIPPTKRNTFLNWNVQEPLLKSKMQLYYQKIEENRIRHNLEIKNKQLKSFNARKINKYIKETNKRVSDSFEYIHKNPFTSLKKRDHTKPGIYINHGLILDIHRYMMKNLPKVKYYEYEGGGHEKGGQYHNITVIDVMILCLYFKLNEDRALLNRWPLKKILNDYLTNESLSGIPLHSLPKKNHTTGAIDYYHILFNWTAPLNDFITEHGTSLGYYKIYNKSRVEKKSRWLFTSTTKDNTDFLVNFPKFLTVKYE